ncbi:GID complex subunit 4, VID24 [Crenichthys baileyi]|uniref:GID complex subunit 4, VID24 n=1 Tax=Crenichthys baileyi TaxID=28760 RepID=A0AAV9SNT0_9TELE
MNVVENNNCGLQRKLHGCKKVFSRNDIVLLLTTADEQQPPEYPTLTTFFAGEIISRKRPFLTRKWDADEDVDRKHWGKFQAFYQYAKTFNSDEFDYEDLKNSDYIFMRWKEQFLVPDHTIKDISGASFAGFYYICFQKSTATIEGYYYHRSSEWYQSLNLTHVPEHSAAIYEFR